MLARADRGIVDEGSHRDMHEGAIADDRIEQRTAELAVRIVGFSRPNRMRSPSPFVMASFLRSMPANGLNAEPVVRRQFEQWQFMAYKNSSATAYCTAPHMHFPASLRPAFSGFVIGSSDSAATR